MSPARICYLALIFLSVFTIVFTLLAVGFEGLSSCALCQLATSAAVVALAYQLLEQSK